MSGILRRLGSAARNPLGKEDKTQARVSCTIDPIVGLVQAELDEVKSRLQRGKGKWPTKDYVHDATWDGWLGEQYALKRVIRILKSSNKEDGEK